MSPYDLPDYHALIRRIREIDRAGGDSTLARLVTADWLEEHGEEERAAFARVQVRYAAIWQDDTPERDELSDLLQTRFAVRIAKPTPFAPDCPNRMWPDQLYGGVPREWDWMHGWIHAVRCPLVWWLAHGPDICRRHPVREVVITDSAAWRTGDYVAGWWRAVGRLAELPSALPSALLDLLGGGTSHAPNSRLYETEAAAIADLNPAALRWAEAEADRSA